MVLVERWSLVLIEEMALALGSVGLSIAKFLLYLEVVLLWVLATIIFILTRCESIHSLAMLAWDLIVIGSLHEIWIVHGISYRSIVVMSTLACKVVLWVKVLIVGHGMRVLTTLHPIYGMTMKVLLVKVWLLHKRLGLWHR